MVGQGLLNIYAVFEVIVLNFIGYTRIIPNFLSICYLCMCYF